MNFYTNERSDYTFFIEVLKTSSKKNFAKQPYRKRFHNRIQQISICRNVRKMI